MFTGIVVSSGTVQDKTMTGGDCRLRIDTGGLDLRSSHEGDSICVSGTCLTMLEPDDTSFAADVSKETLALTTLGTPRYAVGFLSSLFTEYVRDLPNDLPANHESWKIKRSHFDIVRASWIDQSGILRRVLN